MIEHRDADLTGSTFRNVDLTRTDIRTALLRDVVITDAWIDTVRVEGEVVSLSVNGVDVAEYVESELDRRHPERRGLRAEDVDGLRRAWEDAIVRTDHTVARARRLPPELLDVQVDGEFSFIQTLRHLVFGFDRWLTGPVFADPTPHFHPLGLAHEGSEEGALDGLDPDAHPSLDDVLEPRRDRQLRLRDLLGGADDAELRHTVASPNGGETTVLDCVHVVLNEEWWHHRYAARDLAILEARDR
jgi:hypothetical protein